MTRITRPRNKWAVAPGKTLCLLFFMAAILASTDPAGGVWAKPQSGETLDQNDLPIILSDGQFVYGSNVGTFELAVFLNSQLGILKQDKYQVVIQDQAIYYSINPKVLLTLIEMQSGLVTDPQPSSEGIANPIGYPDRPGFVLQMQQLGERLSTSFYWYLYDYQSHPDEAGSVELTLSDGSVVSLPPQSSAGTYAVQATLADALDTQSWRDAVSLDSKNSFYQTYQRLFPGDDPLDPSNTIVPDSTPPSGLLKLPYACNDTWYFYQGPHDWNGCCGSSCPTDPRSSLDFGPGTNCSDPIPTNEWITAAAAGSVSSVSCNGCMVVIDHGDGWQSRYYHVANVAVSQGQVVSKDAHIGNPSCRPSYGDACGSCGGSASGKHHVHFAIYNNGYQPIDGTSLEGWTVHETGCYAGYLQKGSITVNEGGTVTSENCGDCCGCGSMSTMTSSYTLPSSSILFQAFPSSFTCDPIADKGGDNTPPEPRSEIDIALPEPVSETHLAAETAPVSVSTDIDTVPLAAPILMESSDYEVDTWTNKNRIHIRWVPGGDEDAGSELAGYS